ncbi:MAG TPA: hypothetical protein VFJ02_04885 [Vicinamibacterales bacterium]|nr:hypothetical protein [Vicinamibacterales bacterium]
MIATTTNSSGVEVARLLHVANGTATTALIERAGIGGARSIWADPLHDGPVPGGLSDAQLVAVRASHLAVGHHEADVANELLRWRQAIDDTDSYDELVLWFEHDLFDQLNLVQLLSYLLATRSLPWTTSGPRVSLICINSFPGRARFRGLGELAPDDIRSLLNTRSPVTRAQYDLATAAWSAFRASIPTHLEELLRQNTAALPYLAAALHRHLEEFPWTSDGLTRSERRVLTLAREMPIEIRSAFSRMQEDETAFFIGDTSFYAIVRDLASGATPLLHITNKGDGNDAALPHATIGLTDAGRSVLSGDNDRIELCGFDRWLGGVHVSQATGIWRWDPRRSRLTAS